MNTTELITVIKERHNHAEFKLTLKEKYKNQLIIVDQGGMWSVDAQFLAQLHALQPHYTTLALVDLYENPVEVNLAQLTTKCSERYSTVMSNWARELAEGARRR